MCFFKFPFLTLIFGRSLVQYYAVIFLLRLRANPNARVSRGSAKVIAKQFVFINRTLLIECSRSLYRSRFSIISFAIKIFILPLKNINKFNKMKKKFLFGTLLFCCIGFAQVKSATSSGSKVVKFGLKAGINSARLTDFENAGYTLTSRIGFNIGGYLNVNLNDKFVFQPELLYTTQGIVQNQVVSGTNIEITYKLDYIAVPLMIKFYPTPKFNIEFGPQLAFIVNKEFQGKGNGQTVNFEMDSFFQQNNIRLKTNTLDFALNLGLGYEIAKGLNLNGRYSIGTTKVFEGADNVDSNGNQSSVRNMVLSFGLGYTFK